MAGRPISDRCFERLVAGATELIPVIGYRGEQIVERYGEAFDGVPVRYARQERPEGMADALLAARAFVDGPFTVMDGDSETAQASLAAGAQSAPATASSARMTPSNVV